MTAPGIENFAMPPAEISGRMGPVGLIFGDIMAAPSWP
jgi:hypothetical protein